MLKVQNLNTYHGWNHALRGIDLNVSEGELVAVVGANGSGKSTLLGTLAGLYPRRQGTVVLNNVTLSNLPAEEMVRRGVSLVPERRQVFDAMSVYDNLLLGAYHRFRRESREVRDGLEEVLNLFPLLRGREHTLAGTLSGGMQQMLAIGRGLMARPRLLMLDEPSLGLAPMVVREIMDTMDGLRHAGTTILLVEQNARAAMRVADRMYVMDQGRVTMHGRPDELAQDRRVQRAYLGRRVRESNGESLSRPVAGIH